MPETKAAVPRCPICGRPTHPRTRPFCSVRCAEIDLGRWLGGEYRIPGDPAEPEAERVPDADDPA